MYVRKRNCIWCKILGFCLHLQGETVFFSCRKWNKKWYLVKNFALRFTYELWNQRDFDSILKALGFSMPLLEEIIFCFPVSFCLDHEEKKLKLLILMINVLIIKLTEKLFAATFCFNIYMLTWISFVKCEMPRVLNALLKQICLFYHLICVLTKCRPKKLKYLNLD